jgi:hypothetical protein
VTRGRIGTSVTVVPQPRQGGTVLWFIHAIRDTITVGSLDCHWCRPCPPGDGLPQLCPVPTL